MNKLGKLLMAIGSTAIVSSDFAPTERLKYYTVLGGGLLNAVGGIIHTKPVSLENYEKNSSLRKRIKRVRKGKL